MEPKIKLLGQIILLGGAALFGYAACFYLILYRHLIPAKIDPDIEHAAIFRKLDTQKEILNGTEMYDSIPRKKSSGVIFYADKKPETKEELEIAGFNNCRAMRWKGKTRITLGISSGFSGGGYEINYQLGRFEIEPYSFTDVVPGPANDQKYRIIKQEVTLNKFHYAIGDSIYGKIDMEMEKNFNDRKYKVFGYGYFRTKVEEW